MEESKIYELTWPAHRAVVLITMLVFLPCAVVVGLANRDGPSGDGPAYLDPAQALAAGLGYQAPHGAWPGKPYSERPPLWPFIESLALRLSHANTMTAVHLAGLLMHAATIFGVTLLTWVWSGSPRAMIAAGAVVSAWPGAVVSIIVGNSEPCAGAVISVGVALMCLGGKRFWLGVVVLSFMPLVRANFLILPLWIVIVVAVRRFRTPGPASGILDHRVRLAASLTLLCVPAAAWIGRNYLATGRFPVLAADQGAAFYGSYNAITTTWGPRFAEWIYPGMLPGEEPRTQLAKRMSEIEADEYWGHKAKQFVRSHWRVIPAMLAAHVARALLLPQRSAAPNRSPIYTYPEWIFRLGIYAASVVLFIRKPLPLTSWHGLLVAAAALTTGTTTILFYGQQRFLYPLTVLLVSFVCCRLLRWEEHWRGALLLWSKF